MGDFWLRCRMWVHRKGIRREYCRTIRERMGGEYEGLMRDAGSEDGVVHDRAIRRMAELLNPEEYRAEVERETKHG